jgi:glycine oxidase
MAETIDVLVVGGGIIGLAIARETARAGLRTTLLERGEPGCEASTAAAGMLGAQVDAEPGDPLLAICLASRELYPAFARQIASESGIDPCLMDHGTIEVARDEDEMARLLARHAFQRELGLPVERLDRRGLLRLEPSLDETIAGGLFLPSDRSIDNALLVRGLRISAERSGARLRTGIAVDRLVLEAGRVAGVEAKGERIRSGAVVVAAGAWTGEISGDGVPPLPSHPVRGQMVALSARTPRHIVCGGGRYLVPRSDGRVLVGSTMERVGFDRRVTAAAVESLVLAAAALVPRLRGAPVRATWAGLRPACEDGLPAIGAGPAAGLYYACGHLRNGILLAPITARLMLEVIRGGPSDPMLARFDPRRFAGRNASISAPSGAPPSPAAPGSRP